MAKGNTQKSVPGKSIPKADRTPMYKPNLWLDGSQVPKELKNAKPGDKVTMTVTATVTNKSESLRGGSSMSVELQKMAVNTPKK